MKEDYLWDKTGDDAEIAALENALRTFRYRETAPPALPAPVVEAKPAKPRRFFQLGFAFAALAALVAAFLIIRRPASELVIPGVERVADVAPAKRPEKTDGDSYVAPRETGPVKAIEASARRAKSAIVKTPERFAPAIRRSKPALRTDNFKEPPAGLTAEEKYAYDQLMLALSITGSQLKIVRDKIDGLENKTAAVDKTK